MRALITAAVVALALLSAAVATAAKPTVVQFWIEEDFEIPFTSAVCGVESRLSIEALVTIRLNVDRSGSVAMELDFERGWQTLYSPETGMSFRFPLQGEVAHFEYPDGVYLGAPATGSFSGLFGMGGKVADAGRIWVEGEVVETFEFEGVTVPLIDFWGVRAVGRPFDWDRFIAGRCEALGGTYDPNAELP